MTNISRTNVNNLLTVSAFGKIKMSFDIFPKNTVENTSLKYLNSIYVNSDYVYISNFEYDEFSSINI